MPAVVSKLLDQNVIAGRMRRSGGGRKRVEKKISDIVVLIEFLLEYDTAGDPIKGLKWPRRTTEKIAMTLEDFGVTVSPNTVARLLHKGYSLRVNHKSFPPISVPTDEQFLCLTELRSLSAVRSPHHQRGYQKARIGRQLQQ